MPEQQSQEMIQSAQQVVGDQTQQLDPKQGYQALDPQGDPYAYFILNKQVPQQQQGGMIGLMSLQTTKDTKNMRWMWGKEGGDKVEFQKLQPKGSKSVGVGYGQDWYQGQGYQQGTYYQQCQQQQQQQQGQVQIGWKMPPDKWGKKPPRGPGPKYKPPMIQQQQQQGQYDQAQFGCIQIQGQQQQQQPWTFKCPPPPKWGKGKPPGGQQW
jgi:hypothetical protein